MRLVIQPSNKYLSIYVEVADASYFIAQFVSEQNVMRTQTQ